FLLQHVHLAREVVVRRDRALLAEHHAALDLFALRTAEQHADVVAGLALVEQLAEHLDAGAHRLAGVTEADDLELVADLDDGGIGPSGALTTRIAPSICAAPVIMFLM